MKPHEKNKQIICLALGWDEAKYNIYQFDSGYEYLVVKIAIDERIQDIAKTHTWWSWWRQQWDTTDQRFINEFSLDVVMAQNFDNSIRYELTKIYHKEHSPADMKVYPSRVVRQLIDHENQGLLKFKR